MNNLFRRILIKPLRFDLQIRQISTTDHVDFVIIPKRPIPEKAFKKKPSNPAKKRLQDYRNYVKHRKAIENRDYKHYLGNQLVIRNLYTDPFGDHVFDRWMESFPYKNWSSAKHKEWNKTGNILCDKVMDDLKAPHI